MKNECFGVALTVTGGAVAAFFLVLSYFSRAAYLNGFAGGFDAARARIARALKAVNDRKLGEDLMREFDR
jgi:hypothetical protein